MSFDATTEWPTTTPVSDENSSTSKQIYTMNEENVFFFRYSLVSSTI